MSNDQNQKFEAWAIVELFGHQVIAGLVTEQTIGGCSFIRVDVPKVNGIAAFTKFYGQGAIYAMTPTDEAAARLAMERLHVRPISYYALPAPPSAGLEQDDDFGQSGSDPEPGEA